MNAMKTMIMIWVSKIETIMYDSRIQPKSNTNNEFSKKNV
jgi:PDZ domain-containing secreted protein